MKARHFMFVAVFCVICLASFTSYATEVEAEAELVSTEVEAEIAFEEEELVETCSVTVYCPANCCGPLVACNGATSCIGGYDWVECDGVRSYCHYRDTQCDMECVQERLACNRDCRFYPDMPPDPCGCQADYEACRWACCFG